MRKKTIIISSVALVFLIALVSGIFLIPIHRDPAPITLWDQKQVDKAMGDISPYVHYFGKYNGYYVVGKIKMTTDIGTETIAGYNFVKNSYALYVLKEGLPAVKLAYAYAMGRLSDEDIAKIHEYQLQTLRDFELELII